MDDRLYSRDEVIRISGSSEEQFEILQKAGILEPAGRTGGSTPVYDAENLREIPKLVTLLELGYTVDEIHKIQKKIGLPRADRRRRGKTVPYLTVGELAQQADVSPRTIKHWEEKEIFEPETRTEGGFRLYPEVYVLFCRLIKDLQNFGYRLEEIKQVADMFRRFYAISRQTPAVPPEEAEADLQGMREKIAELRARMGELKAGVRRWEQYTAEKVKEIDRLLSHCGKARRRREEARTAKPEDSPPSCASSGLAPEFVR